MNNSFGFSQKELTIFKKLNTPIKIQDFLDSIPFNHEKKGETCMSPRKVLREKTAHCMEGAMLAYTALTLNKEETYIVSLKVNDDRDYDHIVTLYKRNGYWGAISKTNHAVLSFRDPIYKTIRELVLSYFNEYFLVSNGKKTLVGYSDKINLKKFGTKWMTEEKDLFDISGKVFKMKHKPIVPKDNRKFIRPATKLECQAASIERWKK